MREHDSVATVHECRFQIKIGGAMVEIMFNKCQKYQNISETRNKNQKRKIILLSDKKQIL